SVRGRVVYRPSAWSSKLLVCGSWTTRHRSGESRGENLPDVMHVFGDHTKRVRPVMLATERAGITQFEGTPDHRAVIDVSVLQRHRSARVCARARVIITGVVLDVPEVGVRQDLLEDLGPGFDFAVQSHQIAHIGVQP